MIKKDHIALIASEYLEGTDRYLVKVSVGKDNRINVYIDGDNGVTIDQCAELSRNIEQKLDRDAEDYELNVSTPGVGEPFVMLRQYQSNIGRSIKVHLKDGTSMRGVLKSADENQIEISEEIKKKKSKTKKLIAGETRTIQMSDIKKASAIIVF